MVVTRTTMTAILKTSQFLNPKDRRWTTYLSLSNLFAFLVATFYLPYSFFHFRCNKDNED